MLILLSLLLAHNSHNKLPQFATQIHWNCCVIALLLLLSSTVITVNYATCISRGVFIIRKISAQLSLFGIGNNKKH